MRLASALFTSSLIAFLSACSSVALLQMQFQPGLTTQLKPAATRLSMTQRLPLPGFGISPSMRVRWVVTFFIYTRNDVTSTYPPLAGLSVTDFNSCT